MIPKIIHRTIPNKTTDLMDKCWQSILKYTPDWEHFTHYDMDDHPIVGEYLHLCTTGAFRGDLIRLEALYLYGGVYLDSDVELIKPIEKFLNNKFFAVVEETGEIGNSVMGSVPKNKIVKDAIDFSIYVLQNNLINSSNNLITNQNKAFGPFVITEALKNNTDYTILDSKTFFPYSYTEKHLSNVDWSNDPEVFGIHRWAGSWIK